MTRRLLYAAGFSLPLALCITLGIQLERTDHVTWGIAPVTLFFALAAVLTLFTWWALGLTFPRPLDPCCREPSFLRTWGILAACNLVVLLGVFPGFFVYDAQDELMEVVTRSFNTHHPLFHVLAMGGTVTGIHKFTGSWNAGIFIYLLLQMLFITAVYARILCRLGALGLKKPLRTLFTLWYALFPTVVMYTICSTKDGLFSAFTTLFVFTLAELHASPAPAAASVSANAPDTGADWAVQTSDAHTAVKLRRLWIRSLICAVFMMLLRNNACYVLVVFVILLLPGLFIGRKTNAASGDASASEALADVRKTRFYLVSIVIISTVIYLFSNRLLITATHARDDEHQEVLTTFIQALGRTYTYHPEDFSAEDLDCLLSYVTQEGLDGYEDRDSDLLKITFNNTRYESDPIHFWKLWAKMGRRHPGTYLSSWLLTSYGLWHPFTVQNVYSGHTVFTFTYTESSYFGYETELPGIRHSLLPPVDAFYRWLSLDATIQRIPLFSLLFAPAFWFWFYAWFAVRKCYQKRAGCLLPLLPLFLLWLTYLIGPYALVRYALPFFTSLPVLTILDPVQRF